jgi:ribosome-associated toxin RatA of RatAB toxin-antitoxin module
MDGFKGWIALQYTDSIKRFSQTVYLMAVVYKSVLLQYSTQQMFALVERVEDYPQFLPWCSAVEVQERLADSLTATIMIQYRGVKQAFTTNNLHTPPSTMSMKLIDGPFKALDGSWQFIALRENACKVEFNLNYEFSSKVLEQMIGPVFGIIANSMVDSFCKQAEKVYG